MMDIKKILQHIDGVEKKKTKLNETANMTVTFNGDTADEVGAMLDRLRGVSTPASAAPLGNMHNDISKFKSAVDNMGADMGAGTDIVTKLPANAPDEKYAGVDMVTTKAGGGLNGPKNPKDIRVKDPSPYEDMDMEEWANEPDPQYAGHDMMLKDLSGGINREKRAYAAAQKGDNAMAVESIKARLYAALAEAENKTKPDFLDMDKDGNKKEPMKKALKDKKVKEAAKPDFLDMDKDGNKKEPMKKAVADKKKHK
jgi:hypothetical protein